MLIRLMTIDDYNTVYSLWAATPGIGLRSIDDSRAGIEKMLRRNPFTCFVAEEDGRLAGCVLCGNDGRRGYIHHMAVAPDFRRQGVGHALVERVIGALRAEGVTKVNLVAFKSNTGGMAFWKAEGFEARDNLVYMGKSLDDKNI